jgi:hypothetical protein
MLSDTLNTNEVKDAAGAEVEFERHSTNERETVFAKVSESPALPHRISVKHTEAGTGLNRRRRSVIRVDKSVVSTVDSTQTVTSSAYTVVDAPVGALTATTEIANTLAELCSLVSTLATNTHLYDGTGNGAKALINGTL